MSEKYKVILGGKELSTLPPIYLDDTIDTLKRKIIQAIGIDDIAYDSLYLFAIRKQRFNPERIYQQLTQNETLDLTHSRLMTFLANLEDKVRMPKRKEIYGLDDLYEMRLDHLRRIKIPVGQRIQGNRRTKYWYIVDPKEYANEELEMDSFLVKNSSSMISTTNADLVMNLGTIEDDTFYLELATSFLESDTDGAFMKIYFPFLGNSGILNLTEFNKRNEKLIAKNKKFLSSSEIKKFESVDVFHRISEQLDKPPIKTGIKTVDFIMYQEREMILPLEILFKIIHSTKSNPFVKFNPGLRRENLIRLYSEAQTFQGRKIPYLSKAVIIRLTKNVGKQESIVVLVDDNLVCSIFPNGSVRVTGEFDELLTLIELQDKIRILVNPLLDQIHSYVEKNGLKYDLFVSMKDSDIEVLSLEYSYQTEIDKKLNLKPNMSCISAVFNVIQDNIKKEGGIQMRYKRVSDYNEMDAIDAFMRTAINRGDLRENIIQKIRDNFDLTEEQAEEKFVAFIGEVEIKQGIHGDAKLKIRENPGFKTTIEMEKFKNIAIVTIDIENNIRYLETVPIYIRGLLEMGQGNFEEITKDVCSKKAITKEVAAPEIIIPSEAPFSENETARIVEGEELVFDEEGDDDLLDALLMGSDEEDEDDDEGAGPEFMVGGNKGEKSEKSEVKSITGMSLANPNYFSRRMEERDPVLFLKKKTGKFGAYSRMCPSNIRRQPVILTEEEKQRIDAEHPGSYENIIKYGSDPSNPYYYICPRYWCLTENTSLTQEEVDAGVCGGKEAIIPFDAKKVPEGGQIIEFGVDPKDKGHNAYKEYYDDKGNYIQHHPGFFTGAKHPDGHCIPCCFKSWDKNEQVRRRLECSQDPKDKKKPLPAKREYTATQTDYIKGEDKFPLEPNRKGYLPIELQVFFQEQTKDVRVSELDPVLKPGVITLLRQGVESSPNQSFIACIADVFSDYSDKENIQRAERHLKATKKELKHAKKEERKGALKRKEKTLEQKLMELGKPSIKEMREIIAKSVTLDNYSNYQNGNLVSEFYPGTTEGVSIDDYQTSLLYKQIDTTNEAQMDYLERLIASYENFLRFLRSDDSVIDYQYLWDIITMPNPDIFPKGVNLVIFEIPEDDETGNLEIVCPTNHYSSKPFVASKRTIMLMKKQGYFEPIYLFNNAKEEVDRFLYREANLIGKPNIKAVLSKIRKYQNESCRPLNSMPRKYTFKENIPLDILLSTLGKLKAEILSIELHYNGKAIGVHCRLSTGEEGFVPCFPSNYDASTKVGLTFMPGPRTNYDSTVGFLKKLRRESKGKIPCSPHCKVIEDELVVGIITETNQFISIRDPEENLDDDIKVCKIGVGTDYDLASKEGVTGKTQDNDRVKFIKELKREREEYQAFRNLSRIHIDKSRMRLQAIIVEYDKNTLDGYEQALREVDQILRQNLDGIVEFVNKSEVNIEDQKFYNKREKDYYFRLADELLRYQRIRLFMLESNKYLSFANVPYQINEDEILLLESMITQEFFEGMKEYKRNKYVHFNTYDTAMPIKTVAYSERINIVSICQESVHPLNTPWEQKIFPDGFQAMDFNAYQKSKRSVICTYELLITILENERETNVKVQNWAEDEITQRSIQETLVDLYNKYDLAKVLQKLMREGKVDIIRRIRGGYATLEETILSEHYPLTQLDIWLIATEFKIPILFFGQYKMNVNGQKAFVTTVPRNMTYYMIRCYKPVENELPRFKLILTPSNAKEVRLPEYPKLFGRFMTSIKSAQVKKLPNKKQKLVPFSIAEYIKK